jgi:threonine synthase
MTEQIVVASARPRLMERYARFLPVTAATPDLTLGEGFTPLVRARRLGEALGLRNLYLKVEGQNPTGSFKDRGMVVAVAKAAEAGATAIVCASTGNTSASAAAYGAAAGMEVIVVLPKGQIAVGKLLQALIAGAKVVAIDGNFDQALGIVRSLAEQDDHPVTLVNSVNPFRIEGQKTAAFEIDEELGRAPDVLALPYGGGGNLTAYAKGFAEDGVAPRLVAAQAEERAVTLASAIRIAEPAHAHEVDEIVAAGHTELVTVADAEITDSWLELARLEGVFCEPSSAAGLAALARIALEPGGTVVCVLTGHGLKDTAAVDVLTAPASLVEPSVEAILAEVGA